jgi:REP element-mobilizing transposase RayT
MPQSLVQNYIHIVFSTKHRKVLIDSSIENELYSYIGGICKNLESNPLIVGGHRNHVHILCSLSRKIALMKLVEEIKSPSSKWIKTKSKKYHNFYWQNGYGGFSVHESQVNNVIEYIRK